MTIMYKYQSMKLKIEGLLLMLAAPTYAQTTSICSSNCSYEYMRKAGIDSSVCKLECAYWESVKAQALPKVETKQDSFISDLMYEALWQELRSWTSLECYKDFERNNTCNPYSQRKYHDAYGDHWVKLNVSSRAGWYHYFHDKLDFETIKEWASAQHEKSEAWRQDYIKKMEVWGRN